MTQDNAAQLLGLPERDEAELAENARQSGARIRVAREAAGLTQAQLGAAAGFSAAGIEQIEAGVTGLSYYDYVSLATPLHTDALTLLPIANEREPKAGDALAGAAAHWHLDDTLSACVRALADWYRWDEYLSIVANPDTTAKPTALVSRGVPNAIQPAITTSTKVSLDSGWSEPKVGPGRHDDFDPFAYQERALPLATAIFTDAGLNPEEGVSAQALADAVGIPLGRRPLPERVRATAGNAVGRPLVMLNSERSEEVTNDSGLHMLAHLLCGHITLIAASVVGDNSHRDFGDCDGTTRDACTLASWVASTLRSGVPAAQNALETAKAEYAQLMDDLDDDEERGSQSTSPAQAEPAPDLAFDEDDYLTYKVDVWPQMFRDLAPQDHPDMSGRGPGDTVVPTALAWRHLACVAGGLAHDLSPELIASLGVDLPGRPTRDDVVAADTGYRTISAQLDAWNARGIGRAFGHLGATNAD